MTRVVEAEILDQLPSADEAAVRSRRDLARLNALMGHARLIRKHLTPDIARIADLGAGDGSLLLNVLRPGGTVREVILLDQQRIVSDSTLAAFTNIDVYPTIAVADVCKWLAKTPLIPHTAFVTNLFLHHFNRSPLARLLELASAKCDLLIACEPRRAAWPQLAASLVGLIGCNRVTRHDAVVSVRAGFRDHELSALWPDRAKWQIEERSAGLFSHLFVARRR
jgi:hypothetical protein